jgi:hypothetical protein
MCFFYNFDIRYYSSVSIFLICNAPSGLKIIIITSTLAFCQGWYISPLQGSENLKANIRIQRLKRSPLHLLIEKGLGGEAIVAYAIP